ncbi:MAG: argininosuccinate lyase, partial [Gemmatimonadota bacterium]
DGSAPASAPVDSPGRDPGAAHRMWGGRFDGGPAPTLDALNHSLPIDRRMWREDVDASVAWARALGRVGVLSRDEVGRLTAGLEAVADRLAAGAADRADDEDIHTLVERLLYEEVGELAGKLHTGRSRNDQVATDTRLWALRAAGRLDHALRSLEGALLAQARGTVELVIPAYTHLRRAQPVRLAHWLLSHFWAFQRDRDRLADALARVAVLPLGSGAIAGSGFPVDRVVLKESLGFRSVSTNSLDAVGDRDWVCELVFVAGMIGVHLSRLAEDLIVFSSVEFGFVTLPEAYTTGSSLLPQKRNPDGLELARGKAARLIGDLVTIVSVLKGLPGGYQKDLQEDKAVLFDAFDTLAAVLPATAGTVAGLDWVEDRLRAATADDSILAVDIADALVRAGAPFREAHHAVGRLLREAETRGTTVARLPDDVFAAAHPAFTDRNVPAPTIEAALEARDLPGGTAREAVIEQIAAAAKALGRP